jgi:hypothetical protein
VEEEEVQLGEVEVEQEDLELHFQVEQKFQ